MLASSGTTNASAKPIAVRGDAWNEITHAVRMTHAALRRAIGQHMDEARVTQVVPSFFASWSQAGARVELKSAAARVQLLKCLRHSSSCGVRARPGFDRRWSRRTVRAR